MLAQATLLVDLFAMATTLWMAFYLLARGFPSKVALRAVIVSLALSIFFYGAYNNIFHQVPGTAAWRAVLLVTGLAGWYSLTYQIMSTHNQKRFRWLEIGIYSLAGYISPQDGLPEIYGACNVFVTASEIETQGIVLLEAAASGLPIVAVNATCIPEIVHDGVNGFLSRAADRDGLSHAMSLHVRDGNKATQMGKTSRTLAERHELRFTIDAHEQLYRQLIQQECVQHPTALSLAPRRWWTRVTAWMSLIK